MKKEIAFALFGDNTDYLYFGLKELQRATQLTNNKSVGEILPPLVSGEYDLDYLLGLLKIGLSKCWKEKGRNFDNIESEFEKSFEQEDVGLANYCLLLFEAITASGFFKVPAKPKAPAGK